MPHETVTLEYNDRTNDFSADFHGVTIKAVQDQDAQNPWENYDGQIPMAYASWDRNSFGHGKPAVFDDGFDILNPFAHMSDGFIIRYQRALCEAVQTDHSACAKDIAYNMREYGGIRADYWRDTFNEILAELSSVRMLEALDRIYDLTKIPHYLGVTRGYSQGDEMSVLCVCFPAWADKHNARKTYTAQEGQADADYLGAWAWGDVYGYVIESEDGEHLDSCWGYYGTDFEKSGLLGEAIDAAQYHVNELNKRNAETLEAARPDLYT